jgi:Putative peptidoglycan binding domain
MNQRRKVLTAALLSASMGLGAQSVFAQNSPGGTSMPGGPTQPGPAVPQPGPRTQPTIPGQPAPSPGLPQTDPIPGQPGTIPERMEHPRAGTERDMVISSVEIKKAQEALKAKGHKPGTDGKMDTQTQQALRDFQKANDLPATGVLDEKTANKLGVKMDDGKSLPQREGSGTTGSGSGKSGSSSSSPTPRAPVQ